MSCKVASLLSVAWDEFCCSQYSEFVLVGGETAVPCGYTTSQDVLHGAEVEVRGQWKLLDLPQDKQVHLNDISNKQAYSMYVKMVHIS